MAVEVPEYNPPRVFDEFWQNDRVCIRAASYEDAEKYLAPAGKAQKWKFLTEDEWRVWKVKELEYIRKDLKIAYVRVIPQERFRKFPTEVQWSNVLAHHDLPDTFGGTTEYVNDGDKSAAPYFVARTTLEVVETLRDRVLGDDGSWKVETRGGAIQVLQIKTDTGRYWFDVTEQDDIESERIAAEEDFTARELAKAKLASKDTETANNLIDMDDTEPDVGKDPEVSTLEPSESVNNNDIDKL